MPIDPLLAELDRVQAERRTSGLLSRGNVDLYAQPEVSNPDGSTSTVDSFSVNIDGREVLLPTVTPDGRHLSEDDAIREYEKTGRHLGIFDSPEHATAYASRLHEDYAAGKYRKRPASGDPLLGLLDAVQANRDTRSAPERAYDAVFTPPEAVTRTANAIANTIDPGMTEAEAREAEAGFKLFGIPFTPAGARAYYAGVTQGVGNLLTPGDAVLTALGLRPVKSLAQAAGAARAVRNVQRVADAATAVRGATRVLRAESLPEAAAGVAQMAGGTGGYLASMKGAAPVPEARPVREALPPGPGFVVSPEGTVAHAGADIPMTAAPDGSYVRGVPAEYARREIRGLLPAGPRFIAGEAGVASADRIDELVRLIDDAPRAPRPDASFVRSQPAAVVDRAINSTRMPHEALSVRQYSGDVEAPSAPLIDSDARRLLEDAGVDLAELPSQRGRLITDPNDPNTSIFAHGGRGTPIGDDIRAISGSRAGNDAIDKARRDLLEGKSPTSKLHVAWLDWATGVRDGVEGYHSPQVAGFARGGGDDLDDGFDAFSAAFDEIASRPGGRESGEAGFIPAGVAARVGGAVAGATAGAASGEDTTDRIKRAAVFGVLGAAAPSLLRGVPGIISGAARAADAVPGILDMPASATPPRSGRSGAPIAEPMAGFEPFLSKFSNPLVRDGVASLLAEHGGYAAQRRGVIDSETVGRFAEAVRVDASKALPKGTALNAESITGYARALQSTQQKVNELAALVQSGRGTDADVLALQAARAEADVIGKSLIGARAEAGRALAAFNFYRGVLDTGNVTIIREAVNAPGLRGEAERIARGLAEQPNDPVQRFRWLQSQQSSSIVDKVRSYYYANILSGVKTHERNALGNIANVFTNLVTHPVAAGLDAAVSAGRGTARTIRLDELPSQVFGAVAGLDRGLRDFAFTMRHGMTPGALERGVRAGELGKLDVPRVEFAGGAANPFNIPGRMLNASDALFRSIARNMELYGLAHSQAASEGLRGEAFTRRVAELRSGVTPEGAALGQQADTFAARSVFQEQAGPFASWLQAGTARFPALSFVVPFIKTPANIARQGFEFSPAGFAMSAAQQGGRTGRQAQARAVLGSAAAGALAFLAATDRLSGDGPRDPARRAALMESGWRPNSVRIGDKWVSYSLFQPVSVQASIIANLHEGWQEQGAKSDPSTLDAVGATFLRSMNSFLSQSFLSGLSDFLEAVADPDRSMGKIAGRTASGFIPMAGAVRSVQQATDPVVRQPQGFAETVAAGVPGLSQNVEPRIDRFGEVVTREGSPLRRAADPFNTSSVNEDPVADELSRLGLRVSLPSDRVVVPGGRALERSEETAVKQRRGRTVRTVLEAVMRAPGYQRLNDVQRVEVLERAITAAKRRTTSRLRRELVSAPGIIDQPARRSPAVPGIIHQPMSTGAR